MILFSKLNKYQNLLIQISSKKDYSMKLSDEDINNKIIWNNRRKFLNKLDLKPDQAVFTDLVHGIKIKDVGKNDAGKIINRTDGLITKEKELFLSITVADCLPVFLFDPINQAIGLVHAGWKGLDKNILKEIINKLKKDLKSDPKKILVGIGPGISKCHFEVKKDLLIKFKEYGNIILNKNGKYYLDLKEIAKRQLINSGALEENIEISSECTFCLKNKYFSYRRDKPKELQTMMAIFGLKY